MHEHRPIELLRQRRLVRRAEVAAPLERQPLLLQDLDRVVVRHARERRLDRLELRVSRSSTFSSVCRRSSTRATTETHQAFGELHHVVEVGVGHLGLHHPELGEVAARLRLLGAERRAEAVDPAERHRVGFVVELPALRQERGRVLEVLHREQRGRALAGRRREDRRVGEDEAAAVEEVAHGVDHLVADAQDRLLPRRADPQVAAVHQVVDAVFLRRDRDSPALRETTSRPVTSISKPPGARASARTVPCTMIALSCAR